MEVRKVSSKSQLTLPKSFAGQLVSIEEISEGVLQVKIGQFIPHSERMLHTDKYKKRLKGFDKWMDNHIPEESDLNDIIKDVKK